MKLKISEEEEAAICSLRRVLLIGRQSLHAIVIGSGILESRVTIEQLQTVLRRHKLQRTEDILAADQVPEKSRWVIRDVEIDAQSITDSIKKRGRYDRVLEPTYNWKLFVAIDRKTRERFVRIHPHYSTTLNLFMSELMNQMKIEETPVHIAGPMPLANETTYGNETHPTCRHAQKIKRNKDICYTTYIYAKDEENKNLIQPFQIPNLRGFIVALQGCKRLKINNVIRRRLAVTECDQFEERDPGLQRLKELLASSKVN